mmetsp:Transcript_14335/g.23671  ORF Transcript_14335/g.23671 Transcript_14335/m.23671 type:complete len:228 (+) Transcript_14335:660-1343(+)
MDDVHLTEVRYAQKDITAKNSLANQIKQRLAPSVQQGRFQKQTEEEWKALPVQFKLLSCTTARENVAEVIQAGFVTTLAGKQQLCMMTPDQYVKKDEWFGLADQDKAFALIGYYVGCDLELSKFRSLLTSEGGLVLVLQFVATSEAYWGVKDGVLCMFASKNDRKMFKKEWTEGVLSKHAVKPRLLNAKPIHGQFFELIDNDNWIGWSDPATLYPREEVYSLDMYRD